MTLKQFANFVRSLLKISSPMTVSDITNAVGNITHEISFDGLFIDRSITTCTIPSDATSIGGYAFYHCTGLASITIPHGVTSIGYYAFDGCTSLTSVIIPSSVTIINSSAFANCTGLTSIVIPSSVTSIGGYAFISCTSLTSIVIPSRVTSIGYGAFTNCPNLTDIYCGFAEGAVSGAPWGATNATIHYNSNGPA